MKKRLDTRIEASLRDGLDAQAAREGKSITTLVERYVSAGLARDAGQLIEHNTLPHIREAVREECGKILEQLYEHLSTDLTKAARRSDDRLAALIVKGVRSAGLAQRMLYALISKTTGKTFADQAFQHAKEQTGKELARGQGQKEEEQLSL